MATGVLEQSFWPSVKAFTGQFSTHCPQATQFSFFTLAVKLERMESGVLKRVARRREKQEHPQQLQMAADSPSPSVWGISCIRPLFSANLIISFASSREIWRPLPVFM